MEQWSLGSVLIGAERVLSDLGPFIVRGEIAGSARRRCDPVHDLDLVCTPNPGALFGKGDVWDTAFIDHVLRNPRWIIEGGCNQHSRLVKLQSKVAQGFKIELFLAAPERFGWIYLLRTGPEEFTRELVMMVRDWGFAFMDGALWRVSRGFDGAPVREELIECPQEADVFDALGLPWIPVEDRNAVELHRAAKRRRVGTLVA